MRHLLSMAQLERAEIERIFAITADLKTKYQQGLREPLLPGRVAALLFEKPSLRTRVSFETAMAHLGGSSMLLGRDSGWGSRESLADFARVLSQYVDCIVVRAFKHATVQELARFASCSVVNGLTDLSHPCQALADLYTLRELAGPLDGQTVAYIGDANNVARSLALGCGKLGMNFVAAVPEAYDFDREFHALVSRELPDFPLRVVRQPADAVRNAVAVYTDVWASMGQESEAQQRRLDFMDYQVNEQLMSQAPSGAFFMHCLPAHRGDEVTSEVIDSPRSVVIQQAANRLHVQKGILAWLLGPQT